MHRRIHRNVRKGIRKGGHFRKMVLYTIQMGALNYRRVVFPTRMAVTDSSQYTVTGNLEMGLLTRSYIGQNIPNPGKTEIQIPYFLESNAGPAKIIFRELATSRTILQVPLSGTEGELRLGLGMFPSGIYTYSLEVDGVLIQTRKLVVVK